MGYKASIIPSTASCCFSDTARQQEINPNTKLVTPEEKLLPIETKIKRLGVEIDKVKARLTGQELRDFCEFSTTYFTHYIGMDTFRWETRFNESKPKILARIGELEAILKEREDEKPLTRTNSSTSTSNKAPSSITPIEHPTTSKISSKKTRKKKRRERLIFLRQNQKSNRKIAGFLKYLKKIDDN